MILLKNCVCPNESCINHYKASQSKTNNWYRVHGYYCTRKGKICRYICKDCGKTFSITYYDAENNKNECYSAKEIFGLFEKGFSLNEISVKLGIDKKAILLEMERYF